jgi:hypothetical protein
VRLGTANVQNYPDLSPAQVHQDVATIVEHTTVCGLQEIQVGEDTQVVQRTLPRHWRMIGATSACPIVLNARLYPIRDKRVIRVERPELPRAHVNPVLEVTSVTLARHGREFAVVNTHLISGGYNGKRSKAVRDQWDREWLVLEGEVHRLWHKGMTVFVVGDLNHPDPPELDPRSRFQWLTPTGRPDHVGQLNAKMSLQLEDSTHQAVQLNSDHALQVVSGPLMPT